MTDRITAALTGACIADAASLGFHWLYDPDRIKALAGDDPMFRALDPADFEGFKGVFVHHGKRAGDLSHYGAQMRVMTQSLGETGGFDLSDYQDRFAATFGPGGAWIGYIDKATRGTLANLAAGQRAPSGADDDQLPAVAKLPPLIARGADDAAITAAITATNANDAALKWAAPITVLLRTVFERSEIRAALRAGIDAAEPEVATALRAALISKVDATTFAGEVGRACPLPQSVPVIFHIAARAKSYQEAVIANILAGGDSCGRAIILGAVFGAARGWGGAGVPPLWLGRLTEAPALCSEIDALTAR